MAERTLSIRIEADLPMRAGGLPETALSAASSAGASLIELDIQMTLDGSPLLYHDYTLPNGRWVHETPLEECTRILRAHQGLPEQGELLTLDGALERAGALGIGVTLDLKTGMGPEHRLHRAIGHIVADALSAGVEMHVSDWDHPGLRLVKNDAPDLIARGAVRGRLENWVGMADASALDGVNLAWDCVRPTDVACLQQAGLLVAFFGGWSDRFPEHAQLAGADIVITDEWAAIDDGSTLPETPERD